MGNREQTIGEVLCIIAEKPTIEEMRHQILKLAEKLKKEYPLLVIK